MHTRLPNIVYNHAVLTPGQKACVLPTHSRQGVATVLSHPTCAWSLHDLDSGQVQTVHSCRFVIEATVEENVQRLSGQRAAAMDLSAAVGSRVKQVGQREPLTVRYVVAISHHQCCTHCTHVTHDVHPNFQAHTTKCTCMCHAVHTGTDDVCTFCHDDHFSSMHAQGCCFVATAKLDRSSQWSCLTSDVNPCGQHSCVRVHLAPGCTSIPYQIALYFPFVQLYNLCTNSRDRSHRSICIDCGHR